MKIAKREKIILVLMGVVVLYGVYAFFFESSSKEMKAKPILSQKEEITRIDGLITKAAVTLKENKMSSVDSYIIQQTQKQWLSDPFYEGPLHQSPIAKSEVPEFSYTGYIEHEGVRLAIINGIDYQTGDMIEVPGFTLINIAPSKIVIKDKEGQQKITVPFVEE